MAKSTCCGRVFPAEPELWQQQRNPIALFALHHRDDLARLLRTWQAAHEYAERHPPGRGG